MKAKLSMAFEDLRGKDGNVVIRGSRTSLVLTPLKTPNNPDSASQRAVRTYFRTAAKTYAALSSSQVTAWKDFANTITRTDPVSGQSYHPLAINVFIELTTKFLQLTPTGSIPLTPPTSSFIGDSITLSVTNPSTGILRFTASAGNTVGVTTEILLQKLANGNRTPSSGQYRHSAFKFFTSLSLTQDVTVPAGYYASGYRFIKNATGQATPMIPITTQQVTLSISESVPQKSTTSSTPQRQKKAA